MKKIKIRDLIVKQENLKSELEKMATPHCASGYSRDDFITTCASGYRQIGNWCTSNADSPDEVLF